MESKTIIALYGRILDIMDEINNGCCKNKFIIEKVDYSSISELFIFLQRTGSHVQLHIMPTLLICYKPKPGVTIYIESEPSEKFVPKINLINYN